MTNSSRFHALVLVLVVCMAAGLAQAQVNPVGSWKGTLDTPMGSVEVTIVVDSAEPLAGKLSLGDFAVVPMSEGRLDGDKVSFTANIEFGTLKFDGTVAGDEMKLTLTGTQGDKIPLVAKRQK